VEPGTDHALPDGRCGEIWLKQHGTRGYWRHDDDDTFDRRLPGDDAYYLRTGDLGFISEGEVYVTGRLKSSMKIHGETVNAEDLEHEVATAHPAIRPGGVVAVQLTDSTGAARLVVLCETREEPAESAYQEVVRGVRERVHAAFATPVEAVALLAPRSLHRTSSGKLSRKDCGQLLRAPDGLRWLWQAPGVRLIGPG
jgi:acyl-CoA synthetase (AMP-forming)/AMP-acid ligase II